MKAALVAAIAIAIVAAPATAGADSVTIGPQGDAVAVFRTLVPRVADSTPYSVAVRNPGGRFGTTRRLTGPGADAPSVAVDGDGGAVAAWSVLTGSYFVVRASFRPPGGRFGAAVALGKSNRRRPVVATDASGSALVVWQSRGGIMREASHTPTGGFGEPRDLPDSGTPTGIGPDGAGGLILLSVFADPAGGDGVLQASRRSAGGSFESARPVGRVRAYGGSLLGSNAAGEAVAVFETSAGIQRAYRPAGGEFGAAETIVPARAGCDPPSVDDAGIGGDGRVVVTWTALRSKGCDDGYAKDVFMATATGGGTFGPPLRLTSDVRPATTASVAVNGRGDAAVASGYDGFTVEALWRSAGSAFGEPFSLSPQARGGSAAVGIDPGGRATAVWRQNDGTRVTEQVRDFSASPVGPPRAIAEVPSYRRRADGRRRCYPRGSRTLIKDGVARVYRLRDRYRTKHACLFASGRSYALDFGFDDFPVTAQPLPAIALAGPLVAYVYFDEECGTCGGSYGLAVSDLRTGGEANGFGPDGDPDPATYFYGPIERMVLRRDAAVAWTQCAGTRARCRSGHAVVRVFKLDAGAAGQTLVAKGRDIDAGSLRLRGDDIVWRQGAGRKSAPLRR